MEEELDHSLRPLRERLLGVEVEESDQVDEEEGDEEAGRDRGAVGEAAVADRESAAREGDEEERGEDVGEAERAGDLPLQLRERDREDRREEEGVGDPAGSADRGAHSERRSSASSSARARRESRYLVSSASSTVGRPPFRKRATRPSSASRERGDVVGRRDHARAGLADQVGRRAVRRHGGEDRPLGREVLEDLPGEDALAAAGRLGDQEQERVRVALQLERGLPGGVRDQLEAISQAEVLRPLVVGRAEVAEEADDDVLVARLGERGQERARVALAEEAAGVRDPEACRRACTGARRSRRSRSRSRSSPHGRAARSRAPRPRSPPRRR